MSTRYEIFQIRRGSSADFAAANTLLASGEPAYAIDTKIFKVGDGVTRWNSLGGIAGDTPAGVASKDYVLNAISGVIDAAPDLLNTLNELAAALGDDSNFATTVVNSINQKANLAGGNTFTGYNIIPSGNGNFDILSISGVGVSVKGHVHTSSDITNFNSAVSGAVHGYYAAISGAAFTGSISSPSGNFTSLTVSEKPVINGGYDYEIHVSQIDGDDTTGNGDLLNPVASITKALTLVGSQRKTIIVHPGTYNENPSITVQYTTITGPGLIGGNILLSGTLSTNTGCTIAGIKMTNLTITTPTGTGNVNILNCEISGTLTKSSNADYTVLRLCDYGAASITGAGLVAIFGGNPNFTTVNNAGANVIIKSSVTVAPVLTSGTLSLVDSVVAAAVTNAITSAASSVITLANCQMLTSTLSNVAPIVLNGFYSIINCVYNKPSSTLATLSATGGSTNSIDYFQYINADKFITQGGTSSQYVKGDGSLALFPDNIVYTSGNQTISGVKTFSELPFVNGTGVSISGHTHSLIIGDGSIDKISYLSNERLNVVGSGSTTVTYNDTTNTLTIDSSGTTSNGGSTIYNYADNRLLTSDGTTSGIYAESNLTFDGSTLKSNNVAVSLSGHSHVSSDITNFATSVSGIINNGYGLSFNSPTLTGVPLTPTATSGTNTNQVASTAYVRTEISNLVNSAPATLDTLNELAAALGNDASFSTTVTNSLAAKAALAGATFTGTVVIPTGTLNATNIGLNTPGSGNFLSLKVNNTDVSVTGHTHTASNITDFNSSVSGLVNGIYAQLAGATFTGLLTGVSGNFTQSLQLNGTGVSLAGHTHTSSEISDSTTAGRALLTGIDAAAQRTSLGLGTIATEPSGNYSLSSHSHTASNITDFNTAVSGLLNVKGLVAGTGISLSPSAGTYTVNTLAHTNTIGNGSSTSFTITHNLNIVHDVFITVRDMSTNYYVYPDIVYVDANSFTVNFVTAPTSNQYKISVMGF